MIIIIIWDSEIQTDPPIPVKRPDLVLINKKKKKNSHLVDHRVVVKEREKIDNYLDLAWEQNKLRNMKVPVIPIIVLYSHDHD